MGFLVKGERYINNTNPIVFSKMYCDDYFILLVRTLNLCLDFPGG